MTHADRTFILKTCSRASLPSRFIALRDLACHSSFEKSGADTFAVPDHLIIRMSSELLEAEMPPRPGTAAGDAPPRQQRSRPPRPHQTGPAFELLPPFGKIGVCVAVQQEHVNAAVDSVLKYMSTNPEESVSSVLSAAYRLPRIAPFLARVVSTVAAADEDFHSAIVTR